MSDDRPGVSVVVPVYNSERTVRHTIQSLLALRYPTDRRELIFVDNGSTDATATILAGHEEHVRVLYEPKRSRAGARNRGIRAARHPVVAMTDADCVVDPDWLSRLVAPLKDSRVGISGGALRAVRPCTSIQQFGDRIHDQERAINLYKPLYADTANWASTRSVLLQTGGFYERLWRGEDVDLAYRIVQAGYRIAYQSDAIVYHHHRSDLKGLFQEGLAHGFYSVPLLKKHQDLLRQHGHRRVYAWKHGTVVPLVIRLLLRKSDPNTLFETTFNSGKTLGKILGSFRFLHLGR